MSKYPRFFVEGCFSPTSYRALRIIRIKLPATKKNSPILWSLEKAIWFV